MLKVLNKLVLGEYLKCKWTAMVRLRSCVKTGEMSHTCVMCVPVDSSDMGYESPVVKKQPTASLGVLDNKAQPLMSDVGAIQIVDTTHKRRYIS